VTKLYIPPQATDENLRRDYFSYSKVGTLDILGATFQQAMYENPMSSAIRSAELAFKGGSGRKLTAEEYKTSDFFRPGIEVTQEGIYESKASMLAERYDDREARKLTLSRTRGGFGLAAGQFGTALVASALDPINIASAFIPTMAAARFAKTATMATKLGKAGTFRRGATEGAIGAVAVEPIVYGAARYEQNNDYTVTDSLMNVVFGTTLGGGLHYGAAKVGDALKRAGHKQRVALARTAIAQTVEGKQVDTNLAIKADPVMRNDPDIRGENAVPENARAVPLIDRHRRGNKLPRILEPTKASVKPLKTLSKFVRDAGGIKADDPLVGDVAQAAGDAAGKTKKAKQMQLIASKPRRRKGMAGPEPKSVDDMALAAWEAGYFRGEDRPTTSEFLEALQDDIAGDFKYSEFDFDELAAREQAAALKDEADKYGIKYRGMSDEDFLAVLENRREAFGPEAELKREYDGLTEQEIHDMRTGQYESVGDAEESAQIRARMEEADAVAAEFDSEQLGLINKYNDELQDEIDAMIAEGADPQDFIDEFNELQRLQAKAEDYDSIVTRAKECLEGAGS
jgi:hypothetical protein